MLLYLYHNKTERKQRVLIDRLISKVDQLNVSDEFKSYSIKVIEEAHFIRHLFFNCLPPSERSLIDLYYTIAIMNPSVERLARFILVIEYCFENSDVLKDHKRYIRDLGVIVDLSKSRFRVDDDARNRVRSELKTNRKHWEIFKYCYWYGRSKTKDLESVFIKGMDKRKVVEDVSEYDLKFIKKPPIKSEYGFIYSPVYMTQVYSLSEWMDISRIMESYSRRNNKPIHDIHREAKLIRKELGDIKLQHIENSIRRVLKSWDDPMDVIVSVDYVNDAMSEIISG